MHFLDHIKRNKVNNHRFINPNKFDEINAKVVWAKCPNCKLSETWIVYIMPTSFPIVYAFENTKTKENHD